MPQDEDVLYTVVVNHLDQYSVWPVNRCVPHGWRESGRTGTKAECLQYIAEVWTDMRPPSVRA
jgi:MbtH protein